MSGINDFERAAVPSLREVAKQFVEDSLVGPPEMKPVNAVPFAILLGKLIPHAGGDENPPDAIQSFSKIGRRPASF